MEVNPKIILIAGGFVIGFGFVGLGDSIDEGKTGLAALHAIMLVVNSLITRHYYNRIGEATPAVPPEFDGEMEETT